MHDNDNPELCSLCSPLLADLAKLAKVCAAPDVSIETAVLQHLAAPIKSYREG